jgi:predicted MFS family arabinose efflux permease
VPGHRIGPATDSARSWTMAGVAFVAMFTAIGTGYAYGALLLHLVADLGISAAAASGVFAVTVLVFFLAGAPAGFLADRGGPRRVLAFGAVATGGGLLLTSAAGGTPALLLGHGLLLGCGMASTFVPLLAVVAQVFHRHRTAAMGVAVSGIGVGTLVMAPLVAWLIGLVGWRHTYAGIGGLATVVLLGCAWLLPSRPTATIEPAGPVRRDTTRMTLLSRDYRLLYGAQLLLAIALFIPFALLPAFAESSGVAPVAAAGLVGLLGVASVAGRLLLGVAARRLGLLNAYRGCYAAIGLSFFLWFVPNAGYAPLAAFAVVFGVGYGGFVALLPAVVADRFGVAGFGALVGILYTANALGAGIGPWVAGALVESHGYLPGAVLGLVSGSLGFAVLGRLTAQAPPPAVLTDA